METQLTDRDPKAVLLGSCLELAVPLAIRRLQAIGGPTPADWEWCRETAWVLGSEGDVLLYRGKTEKERARTRELFAIVARGLAIMAHAPGGVTFLGRRWEAPAGLDDERAAE